MVGWIGGVLAQGNSILEDAGAVSCIVYGSFDRLVPDMDTFGGFCFSGGNVVVISDKDGDQVAVVGLERVKHQV